MFSLFDDDAPQWSQPGQGYPENRNTMAGALRIMQTGDTLQNTFQQKTLTDQPSRWAGMDPGDIPFMDHDTTIPTADRFPHNPLGPAVPGPEHIDPATGRFDMDKYMDMVGDRLEVGYGNTEPLAKYRRTGGDMDAGGGAEVAQMQFGPGLRTTHPDHVTGIREKDCQRQWKEKMKQKMTDYNDCLHTPGWTCQDPRQDQEMQYDRYRDQWCK